MDDMRNQGSSCLGRTVKKLGTHRVKLPDTGHGLYLDLAAGDSAIITLRYFIKLHT